MKLHVPAVPHTVTRSDFSNCAYTQKVRLFGPMLRAQGFEVVHYGVEGSEAHASEDVTLLTTAEHLLLLGRASYHEDPARLVGADNTITSPTHRHFNYRLRGELKERLAPGDVLCLPAGMAHTAAWRGLPLIESGHVATIETGIGYAGCVAFNRVYESQAWRHWMWGHEGREGASAQSRRNEWVVPNYYDATEWPLTIDPMHRDTVLYFGRICDVKGCDLIPRLAQARPDLTFVLCGQGDATPYLTQPNVHAIEPVAGALRARILGSVRCTLHPSRFIEPFCGAAVEAMLCGTPAVTQDYGAFTETVVDRVTGFRCRTIAQWCDALDRVEDLRRVDVRDTTLARYRTDVVGAQYAHVFDELAATMPAMVPAGVA